MIFLFPLFLLAFSTLFPSALGTSNVEHLRDASFPEFLDKRIHHDGVVQWNTRRITAETSNNSNYIILAAERTHRRDPSDGFHYYDGGWNITNAHYLYSVGYTATGPIIIAVIWFIVFGLCLLGLCIRRCCCRKKPYGYSRTAYVLSLASLVTFTLVAIAGIAFLYVGQTRLHSSMVNITSYILQQVDNVVVNLKDLLDNLQAAKDIGLGQIYLPAEIQNDIDGIGKTIDRVADEFHNVTINSSHDVQSFFNPLRLTIIFVASAMLILAILGFLLSILGIERLVYCLVIIGWISVAATFIISGMFLLVHNLVADTCVAMDEWLQNPNADSALENIIPKVHDQTAKDISSVTKGVTYGLVSMVNGMISNVSNVNFPPNAGTLNYNQSGPLMPDLCNPYDPNLTDRQCSAGEVNFMNASQVWRNYVCQVSSSGICITLGRLTPDQFNQLAASVNVSNGLYSGMPFLVDLIDSTYLKETFGGISKDHCPNLDQSTRWMYIGFITSSVAVMLSLILWIIYARERSHRAFTKKVNDRSS